MEQFKILLLENIHDIARVRLEADGFLVDTLSYAPSEDELIEKLKNYDALGIRSKTELTEKVIKSNPQLQTIGCFCIGTNQVNKDAAKTFGIPVFNAPHSNTRSVAELVIAEIISLSRQLGDKNIQAHKGEWSKNAVGSREIRGKSLGIIGYGHIGSQVSILAEAMGMKVIFYDIIKKLPLGNAVSMSHLEDLLKEADFITLHVPETEATKDLIGAEELKKMKKGVSIINAARGSVIVIEALAHAITSHHIAGAAIDVFPVEPASNKEKFYSPLQGLPNVILTPHIGGSTEEAQYQIGLEVAESFRRYLKIGSTAGSVNFPSVDLGIKKGTQRIINVHRNEPGVLSEINGLISLEGVNIEGQYLATDEKIGYMVVDISSANAQVLANKINSISRSIRTRVVY